MRARRPPKVRAGQPKLLGGTALRGGANFAVDAPHAERVELCLFKTGEPTEYQRFPMHRDPVGRFHLWVPGVRAGQHYGYRAYGPFEPTAGHYYCPQKLLVDPWCRQVHGPLRYDERHRGLTPEGEPDNQDSAPAMLRSVVTLPARPFSPQKRPLIPMEDTVLYECHVKGMTARHPDVPRPLRGTFLGLCHPTVLEHLRDLSVTTVSLLPVAAAYDEEHLIQKGLTNYWGYAPLCHFAPAPHLASAEGDPNTEFRKMVAEFHKAGIEVVLDVVFNHTAEGNPFGPTLCYRGLDNAAFYALSPEPPRGYVDHTGCGNSFDLTQPTCLRLVLDALRHWARSFGVDGFRFDLATTLGRRPDGFAQDGPFLSALMQDPELRDLKLIAEPWDVGLGGYQLGAYPPGFSEWNDQFRDTVRRFFLSEPGQSSQLATRLAGSSDIFSSALRGPLASVNFITSHDGYTLADVVRYVERHNEANGEENRDGHHANFSQNFGQEGESDDPEIEHARLTTQRAMFLCMAMAHGVPMVGHGDELGRTQRGNNNAYCQDSELTHVDWASPQRAELLPFAQTVLALRKRHACLRPTAHMHGELQDGRPDLSWWRADGQPLGGEAWQDKHLAMRVCGRIGDAVLLLVNGGEERIWFALPPPDQNFEWYVVADASTAEVPSGQATTEVAVAGKSALVLEQRGKT